MSAANCSATPLCRIKRVVHPALVQDDTDLALVLSPSAASLLASGKISNAVLAGGD